METLSLKPHPEHPPEGIESVDAAVIGLDRHWLRVRWKVQGAAGLVLPPFAGKGRADGLWQETCFELFLRTPGDAGYVELNLAPSEQWAAYDFVGYRSGMTERAMPRDPDCTARRGGNILIFDAAIPLGGLPPLPWELGISAVLVEEDGTRSLWALRYPPGPADFHAAACFAARLAAPQAA